MVATKLVQLAEDFIGLVYPRLCVVCNGHLLKSEQGFCFTCEQEMPRTYDELNPTANPVAKVFWGRFPIAAAASCFVFTGQGKVQELVHNLKYNGRKDAGVAAGFYYGHVIKSISPFLTADLILPVPLHEDKLQSRGYNQATCFAQGLSEGMNIPYSETVLVRLKATSSQTRKNREERWDNVGEVFAVSSKKKLEGRHVIIVDDVITTGATLEACVLPLLNIKGIRISVVSLASARS
jgi:ComF family protein